ncbi:MAG: DUF4838 domain-containing protein [Bacteroidales bacterium]|nr:DUF4838 domain-containing protein [Bacteroidales bacterium]
MNNNFFRILSFLILALGANVLSAQNYLYKNKQSDYQIVISDSASGVEVYAANELQRLLAECAHCTLPILKENQLPAKDSTFVSVGLTNLLPAGILDSVCDDGFVVVADGCRLYLAGKEKKSTLYAVYDFLEHEMGFRLYAPTALSIPLGDDFKIPNIQRIENPDFSYREVLYYYPNHSQLYADWHHLHNRADMKKEWGIFVHTFRHLVPAERYFEEHPEWFSEINGKRVKDGQLCLSNPQVLETLCRNLDSMMKLNPDAKIWSVSNNDNYNNCTCEHCHRMDSLYGSPAGTLVNFINQVARRFPDKTISTLAYQYTRQAPQRNIVPDSNVNIMFCSIECGRQEAIETSPSEASFRKDMEEWSKLTNNIFVWDYVVQFRNMLNPFPNLHVLQPNLQFFKNHGVKLMFEQGTGADNKTSWMELRNYLLAKLLWNTNADVSALTTDFCNGYYGPASVYIQDFFAEMTKSLLASGKRLDIYGYPIHGKDGYLSPSQISYYQSLIRNAYQQVKNDPVLTDRVRYLELSLDFAVLELAMSNVSSELSFFIPQNDGSRQINEAMLRKADDFVRDCHRFGIENLEEMGYSPEEFRANIDNYLRKSTIPNLAAGKMVKLYTHYSPKYDATCGAAALTDGVSGILNYNYNWLGFYGEPLWADIDLETVQSVKKVSLDFYFYPLSWIFLPKKVEVYVSKNEKKWEKVGEESVENPQLLAKAFIKTFQVNFKSKKARYVRVIAYPLSQIPEWHRAVGNPCWIFCDEIVVE